MPKIMLKKYHYGRLILALFDALFYACRRKNTFVSLKHNRLQNSPYYCVFKYARAVIQKVWNDWNEAENRERDWGEKKLTVLQSRNTISYCITYKFTKDKRQIMLKSTQTVFFQWNSLSLGYSLISLQPGMMMPRRNQALKVVTKLLNKLISY